MWSETIRCAARNAIAADIEIHDAAVLPTIQKQREAGYSFEIIARNLDQLGYPSPGRRNRTTRYRNHWTRAAVFRIHQRHITTSRPHVSKIPIICADLKQRSASRTSHMSVLTPERWERARQVLHGKDKHAVSRVAAARAAGVPFETFKAWIRRARERRPGDDPLLAKVADDYDSRRERQGDVLEDVLWDRALNGVKVPVFCKGKKVGEKVKPDTKALLSMLAVRRPEYKDRPQDDGGAALDQGEQTVQDMFEAYQRWAAVNSARKNYETVALAEGLRPGPVIEARLVEAKDAVIVREHLAVDTEVEDL